MVHPQVCVYMYVCVSFFVLDPEKTKNIYRLDGLYENGWSISSGSPVGRKVSSAYCTESYIYIYIVYVLLVIAPFAGM